MTLPLLRANIQALAVSRVITRKGVKVRSGSKPVRFVLCSECIGLECECGERLVLIGREEDWRLGGRTEFECECGKKLTLDDHRVDVPVGSSAPT